MSRKTVGRTERSKEVVGTYSSFVDGVWDSVAEVGRSLNGSEITVTGLQ